MKEKIALLEINNDYIEITTLFIDRRNDLIQIYACRENGGYLLTDDNYTIDDLTIAGYSLDTLKRQEILKTILGKRWRAEVEARYEDERGKLCDQRSVLE